MNSFDNIKIIKRDGREKSFNSTRIQYVIDSASLEVGKYNENDTLGVDIANAIEDYLEDNNIKCISVEEVQDLIISHLQQEDKEVAKAYKKYREERERIRVLKHYEVMKKSIIDINSDENSNANVDENNFSGKELRILESVTKDMGLDLLPDELKKRHLNTMIYQHDFAKFVLGVHNCLFPDYVSCLEKGFETRQGDTKPAQKYLSACQLIPVILQLQSQEQFGGAGIANYSIHMVKYLKMSIASKVKEVAEILELDIKVPELLRFREAEILLGNQYHKAKKLIDKEVVQAHQALITNLVTLQSRSGGQVPFTSINLGLIDYKNADESAYMIEMFLNELDKGIGKKDRTAIFPITIFQVKKGLNRYPTDPYYYLRMLAQKVSNKRLYPTFSNLDWSQNKASNVDEELQMMGCRTIITNNIHTGDYAKIGRGNLAPSTMNLAYLSLYSNRDIDTFFNNLDENLELAMKGLLLRYDIMTSQSPKVAPFMYGNRTILGAENCKDTVEPALKNCSLAIGYVGLAECLYALTGKYHSESKEVQQLGIKIVKRIREFCDIKKQELNMNIGVYPAPAEGLCKTGMDAIKRDFGDVKGITDNEYLTNSHHTRVEDGVSVFEKIDIESEYAKYCNGGNIFHIEIDGVNYNEKAITKAIDYAMDKDIPYIRLSHPIATCMDCSFSMPKYMSPCEKCNSENVENLAIVTGYLTTDISNMNKGKQDEISKRKLNKLEE